MAVPTSAAPPRRVHAGLAAVAFGLALSARAAPDRSETECTQDLAAAQAEVRRGDQAAAGARWVDAVRAYRAADGHLRAIEDHCSIELAEKASAAIDDLLAKKAAAEAADPQADCTAAREAAQEQERKAQAAGEGSPLWTGAESAWGEVAAACAGDQRQAATERQAAAAAKARPVAAPAIMAEKPATPVPEPASPPPKAVESAAPPPVALRPAETAVRSAPAQPPAPVAAAPMEAAPVKTAPPAGTAEPPKSFAAAITAAAAAAAGFIDRTVAGAATALGLPPVEGEPKSPATRAATGAADEVLRVGTTTYTGGFRRDAAGGTVSGQGRVEWSNGDLFTGTLVRGKAEGRGTMFWQKTGSRYEGEWQGDQQTGRGTMTFGDGTRYSGDFVAGRLTGQGRYEYAGSGDAYEGEVQDGKPHGQGTYTWKSGERYQGRWVAGRKHGQGRYTWPDGSYWEGEYRDDQQTENGRTVFPIEAR